jgi:hypothetical protein
MEKMAILVRRMNMVGHGWWGSLRDVSRLLDEGGIRCLHDGVARYVPYLRILGIRVERVLLQRRLIIVDARGGVTSAELPLGVDATALVVLVLERREAARATEARHRAARGDLAAWIATVSASSVTHGSPRAGGGFYRMSSIDDATLEETLADPTDAAEARAASAHALLARGRPELVARRIGHATPPLVIAAARLGRGGEMIVGEELLAAVLPFLELRDRVVFAQRARVPLVA